MTYFILGGAGGTIAGSQLPWKKLPKNLADQGLIFTHWPMGVDFPGENKPETVGANPGIRALDLATIRLLAAACDSSLTTPQCVVSTDKKDGELILFPIFFKLTNFNRDLLHSRVPIFMSVAPPIDSPHPLGRRGFVDGRADWNGLPRLTRSMTSRNIPRNPSTKASHLQTKIVTAQHQPTASSLEKNKVPVAKSLENKKPTITVNCPSPSSSATDDAFVDASSLFSSPPALDTTPIHPRSVVSPSLSLLPTPAPVAHAPKIHVAVANSVPSHLTKRTAVAAEGVPSGSNAKKPRVKAPQVTQPAPSTATSQGQLWPASGFTAMSLLRQPSPNTMSKKFPEAAPISVESQSPPPSVQGFPRVKKETSDSAPAFAHGWHGGVPNSGPPQMFTGPGYPGYMYPGQYPPYPPHQYSAGPHQYYAGPHHEGPYPPRGPVPHGYPQHMQHFNPAYPAYSPFHPVDHFSEEPQKSDLEDK